MTVPEVVSFGIAPTMGSSTYYYTATTDLNSVLVR